MQAYPSILFTNTLMREGLFLVSLACTLLDVGAASTPLLRGRDDRFPSLGNILAVPPNAQAPPTETPALERTAKPQPSEPVIDLVKCSHQNARADAKSSVTVEMAVATNGGASSKNGRKIPPQLILTGKQASFDELPHKIRHNIHRTLKFTPELRLRWVGDCECLEFIKSHYDDELARIFATEPKGMFRGDLCRAAVLAKEGGFYTDLDVQMKEPLTSLVSDNTTFMSAVSLPNVLLNAIMAAAPGSAIVLRSIEHMRAIYRSGVVPQFLGPQALYQALHSTREKECAHQIPLASSAERWLCGSEEIRMLQERFYSCWPPPPNRPKSDCPSGRALSMWAFDGAGWGIFAGGPEDKLVGWSRMEECLDYGCGAGGPVHSDDLRDRVL